MGRWEYATIHGTFSRFAFAAAKSFSSHSYILATYASSKNSGKKNASVFHATTCAGPASKE